MVRMTRQRSAVSELLGQTADFRSAQQLHESLRAAGESVGLATVYRTLQALADAGEVDVLRADDGESLYRRCARREHHHHLVCRECGRTEEVAGEDLERWAARTAVEHGFVDVDHTAEIFGTCAACAARAHREAARA
ncbi:transcriptional repressor [Georgenia sp. TF02-10]|uniref:Fur family transcriptional regulator n=1 Tax=Georgenia sp. TF02-10 TaxID=2917725 RepID=UPI001FA76407|nr:Fur family transcriptional regulator [Georgenia sp. TF02-10]UNX53531.1 transcriptional repressor [Georgenia sp. TF02-10]